MQSSMKSVRSPLRAEKGLAEQHLRCLRRAAEAPPVEALADGIGRLPVVGAVGERAEELEGQAFGSFRAPVKKSLR